MRPLVSGLQAKFAIAMAIMMVVVLSLLATLLHRQSTMQAEVAELGRQAMHGMVEENLQRQGEAAVEQLAEMLANPLYYFDLEEIGSVLRSAQKAPDVSYALVYDAQGRIIHDGTDEIASYGRQMSDPLAYEAINGDKLTTQWSADVVDVSEPIMVGEQRLGGVRVGYSIASVRAHETSALAAAKQRLDALGQRHLLLVGALLAALMATCVVVVVLMQRTLVRPIRDLAAAARAIEAGNYESGRMVSHRRDELGELMRGFSTMSESIARHDRDVRRMAYTDSLTGLTNRLAFRESLDHRLMMVRGAGRHLALLFADIDDFKRVNDTLGHEAGDEVLLQFANRINESVQLLGGDDALLARFGGDEFVILIQDGDVRARATQLAENLVAELSRPLLIQDRQVFLGTSIGITLFPEDAAGASALMKNGDIAMYQAKVAGKNCYRFYSRAMDQAVERRVRMEQELRGAWERGELSLVYQPVVRLSDGKLVGAEALLRWQHPELGMVAPSVFIDVAEQSGLIEVIGPRVLRAACAAAARWGFEDDTLEKPFISVNVSPRQLRSGDLPETVAECLRETGLAPGRLHLELTETAVISDEAHASALLSTLHRAGVKVWLDDFGTGFSGLSHLRRVPVDGVKIDRSFIADMLRDPDDLALTTAIIAMAHSLGITVVAEGVEQEGQLDLLRERGCDLAQGYWLGYPVSAHELNQMAS
ncbi:putative bifunctional diguanylate cyclase/phosphodiesterase [Pseudoxanthomonas dokdonensis]|uniref:DeoR faimly transcriptional regulator n=1 Tax=Pseudoxanthomonas dokdonensis TaxID=344882 RepID=A0A0R0CSM4_9GAMM|nr:EAL domain-containing protein [Pseudoxanthomonas dokdonensis]KRG69079.1 DeoR faimly transcriptional regulator [Pseudoxanthomonas dokdonensis]